MRTLFTTVVILSIVASNAFATSQGPDKLIYEGNQYWPHRHHPMEAYFRKHPDKRPQGWIRSTALRRGYLATFELRENTLVLKDIEIEGLFGWKSVKGKVVPKGKILEIDWFTGVLVLPYGKVVHRRTFGYGPTHSNYLLLEIQRGKLTGKRTFNQEQYEQFIERQFQAYKKTKGYKKQAAELAKEGRSQEQIDALLELYILDYTFEFRDDEEEKIPQQYHGI